VANKLLFTVNLNKIPNSKKRTADHIETLGSTTMKVDEIIALVSEKLDGKYK
jgi:hypothetical protein